MKKMLTLLLASALALTTACGNGGGAASSAPAASSMSSSRGDPSSPAADAPVSSQRASGEESEILQVAPGEDATTTDVEYIDRLNAIFPVILEKLPRISELTAEEGDASAIVEDLKAPFEELAQLTAPEKYSDVQAKMKESATAMMELVDSIVEISALNPEDVTEETRSELSARMNDLAATVGDAFAEALELAGAGTASEEGETVSGEQEESGASSQPE